MPSPKSPGDFQAKKPKKPKQPKSKPTQVSAASAFKKASSVSELVQLPTGNVVRIRRIPIADLLTEGIIPDTLTSIVESKIRPESKKVAKKPTNEEVRELMRDPNKVKDLFDVFDRVSAKVVIEPEFVYHRRQVKDAEGDLIQPEEWENIPAEDRNEDLVYTDEVDFGDKSFIFQYSVGGTADLERFRGQTGTALGTLADGQDLPLQAESALSALQ